MKRNGLRNRAVVSVGVFLFGALSLGASTRMSDAQLQAKVNDKLYHAKVGVNVTVKVSDAVAMLDGTVDSIGNKERAAKEASKIDGIQRVSNNLQVPAGLVTDEKILEECGKQIRRYAFYTIFDNVNLKSQEGRLTLFGEVTQPWRREDIGRLVSMVRGVREIENALEVLPVSPMDDQIRVRVARAIYREPVLSRYGIQSYPPIHIVVKNGNVTLTGVVHDPVEKAVAEVAARFAATYFTLKNELVVETQTARAGS